MQKIMAILGYHYPTGKWHFLDIIAGPLSADAKTYERCQIKKLCYTVFTEAPIKNLLDNGEIEIFDDFIFPDVITLEQSIKSNQETLKRWLSQNTINFN